MKRIIPCLDVDQGRVVKGVRYIDHVDAGDPVEVARLYDEQEADEIIFLDITASHEGRGILLDVVVRTAETVFMPLTVGGGVRSLQDIRDLLNAGADKVSIMTAAVENPDLVGEAAVRIGSANLVVAIDARRHRPAGAEQQCAWEVFTHGGRRATGIDAVDWAKQFGAKIRLLAIAFAIYPFMAFYCGPLRRWSRRQKGLCVMCAYDLTGNESGVCPECGERTSYGI